MASSRSKLVPTKEDSPRPRGRFGESPTPHRPPPTCSAHGAAAPHHPHLPARCHSIQRFSTLRSKLAPVGHPKDYVEHHRSAKQVRRVFPLSSPLRAPRPSCAPTPASARNLDFQHTANPTWRIAPLMHLDSRPGFERVAPRATGSGLVYVVAVYAVRAVRRFAYGLGYVSTFYKTLFVPSIPIILVMCIANEK
jgi:hypothetical protein